MASIYFPATIPIYVVSNGVSPFFTGIIEDVTVVDTIVNTKAQQLVQRQSALVNLACLETQMIATSSLKQWVSPSLS